MKDITGGICTVEGVSAWGIKEGKYGLALITASGSAAGMFTLNSVIAAPLILTKQHLKSGRSSAVIINSGNANAFTGAEGLEDAAKMARLAAERLGVKEKAISVASTGVIGRRLDMGRIESQFERVLPNLTRDHSGSAAAARAIMTTDTVMKEVAVELSDGVHIGGIAKGSGMIAPNMGTMLAFLYTDAGMDAAVLKQCLETSVNRSFNMVIVDGDTSTNDMVLITATARSGPPDMTEFQQGLDRVCTLLAKSIARDGEGATHLIEAQVTGAADDSDGALAAKAIVRSPLVKSAIFGRDPNWGRIVAAVGYSGARMEQDRLSLVFAGDKISVKVVEDGSVIRGSDDMLKKIMESENITISVDLHQGSGSATAWGCDLTYDYVRINAEYTT